MLSIVVNGYTISFNKEPTYLGNKLDRPLTYNPLLQKLSQKFNREIIFSEKFRVQFGELVQKRYEP